MLEKQYMTVDEVASVLQVSASKVKQMCQKGTLPAFKVGQLWRIDPADLHDFIDASKRSFKPDVRA